MKITNEDKALIERALTIRKQGKLCSAREITELYNRVMEKNLPVVSCSSCINQRIRELGNALAKFNEQMEKEIPTPAEEPKPTTKKRKGVKKNGTRQKTLLTK